MTHPLMPSVALSALLVAGIVRAECTANPAFLPLHYRVGADAANCDYDDVQSALDAVGECATIVDITREHLYTQQHLTIVDKADLTLQGWGDGVTCADIRDAFSFPPYAPPDSTQPLVTLDGSSDNGGSVLHVTGTTNLTLRNLTITHGQTCNDCSGGGIYFDGAGALTLTRSTLSFNEAGYGAGIDVNGSTGPATLTLGADTLVLSNAAGVSGGGIRMHGASRLYALAANTLIAYNRADGGNGGGFEVVGPARADIGSPGYNGLGVVYGNAAQYGGGIAVTAIHENDPAIVRLFTTDAAHPIGVSNNGAAHTGGGVFLVPYTTQLAGNGDAKLCAFDFRIDDNAAANGAAIYGDLATSYLGQESYGSRVALNGDDTCADGVESLAELGAVRCASGAGCNTLDRNLVEDENGNPTDGATILMQDSGELSARRFSMRGSRASEAIRVFGDANEDTPFPYAALGLADCLIAGNTIGDVLIRAEGVFGQPLTIDGCTFADNAVPDNIVVAEGTSTRMSNTLIAEGAHGVAGTDVTSHYVLAQSTAGFGGDGTVREIDDPGFVDAANGDYHLALASVAIDYAGGVGGVDLDRRPRDVDLPERANVFGPRDVGAYERPLACDGDDTLFCDGFDSP